MYEEQGIRLLRILTDRGTEYCGKLENHPFQLYIELEDIDHSRTKAKSPQTNGICERFHRTIQEEFYSIVFRKKVFRSIEELQIELDGWIDWYNTERTHSGKYCYGKTPWETFMDSKQIALEKQVDEFPWQISDHSSKDDIQPSNDEKLQVELEALQENEQNTNNLTTKTNL